MIHAKRVPARGAAGRGTESGRAPPCRGGVSGHALSSANDDEVGGLTSAIRAERVKQSGQRFAAPYLIPRTQRATQCDHQQDQRYGGNSSYHGPLPFRLDQPQDDHSEGDQR